MARTNKKVNRSLRGIRLEILGLLIIIWMVMSSTPVEARPFAYVTNSSSQSVSVIDTATNAVVDTIPVGANPTGVAITPDGAFAYVTNQGDPGTVSVIETASNTVVAAISVGLFPTEIAITPDGAFAYVTNLSVNGTVSVIETASNTVVATVPVGLNPRGVAFTPDGAFAYIVNSYPSNSVSVIETASNTVVTTVPVGNNPIAVAITPDGAFAYVTNGDANTISVIETAGNTVVTTIPVAPRRALGIAITPDGTLAYVAQAFGFPAASAIDTASNTVVAELAGPGMQRIALTPDGAFAYMTNTAGRLVFGFETTSNTEITRVPVETDPIGVAITPFISDLTITKAASPDPVPSGSDLTYTIALTNNGPDPGLSVTLADALPEQTTFRSLAAPEDWSCTTPAVGDPGAVNCSTPSLASQVTQTFTIVVNVNRDVADRTVLSNTATVSTSTFDPDPSNNMASVAVTVSNPSR